MVLGQPTCSNSRPMLNMLALPPIISSLLFTSISYTYSHYREDSDSLSQLHHLHTMRGLIRPSHLGNSLGMRLVPIIFHFIPKLSHNMQCNLFSAFRKSSNEITGIVISTHQQFVSTYRFLLEVLDYLLISQFHLQGGREEEELQGRHSESLRTHTTHFKLRKCRLVHNVPVHSSH